MASMNETRSPLADGGLRRAAVELAGWLAEEGATEVVLSTGGFERTRHARETDLPGEIVAGVLAHGSTTVAWSARGVTVRLEALSFLLRLAGDADASRLLARLPRS